MFDALTGRVPPDVLALLDRLSKKQLARLALHAAVRAKMIGPEPGLGHAYIEEPDRRRRAVIVIAWGTAHAWFLARATREIMEELAGVRMCRFCGCTEASGCSGGCHWIADDVCSHPECRKQLAAAPSASRKGEPHGEEA